MIKLISSLVSLIKIMDASKSIDIVKTSVINLYDLLAYFETNTALPIKPIMTGITAIDDIMNVIFSVCGQEGKEVIEDLKKIISDLKLLLPTI